MIKKIGVIGIILISGVAAYLNRWIFFFKFEPEYWENYYYESQWNIPQSPRVISDGGVYRYIGYRLVNGENPFNVDYWVPPLGKYLYGLSAKFFNNPYLTSFMFYVLAVLIVGLLSKGIIKNEKARWLTIFLFALNPLVILQISLTMLDLPMTFFWILGIWFLFKSRNERGQKNVCISGICFGLMAGVKPAYFVPMIAIVSIWWLYKFKEKKSLFYFLACIPIGYCFSYFCYFIKHPNPIPWLRLHKKIIDFQKGNGGSHDWINILRTIFLDQYWGFWSGATRMKMEGWSLILPTGVLASVYILIKQKRLIKIKPEMVFLALLSILYIFMNFTIDFWPRYLVPLVPFLVLIIGYLFRKKEIILWLLLASYIPFLGWQFFPGPEMFLGKFWENYNKGFYRETYRMLSEKIKTSISEDEWKILTNKPSREIIEKKLETIKEHNEWKIELETEKNFQENKQPNISDNRFATVINPVRGRDRWWEGSLKPIRDQYQIVKETGMAATWLLQYDVLADEELKKEIKNFNEKQELGLFLEVSPRLAQAARVVYPVNTEWYKPQAIFLSGYGQRDRIKLIDEMMKKFENSFGYLPKSAGAWWIDSYSMNYLKTKYKIEIVLIVADQKTTDNYGVWGQWWGAPYYADEANILVPNQENGTLVVQWALRDPVLAYQGEGPKFSNFSMQANDYRSQRLDINYFKKLANIYLDRRNRTGQITVGLETGMESIDFINEYRKQLETISKMEGLQIVTMSDFNKKFREINKTNPEKVEMGDWMLTKNFRENKTLGELTQYKQKISFGDYFVADKNGFLDRRLPVKNEQKDERPFPYWMMAMVVGIGLMIVKRVKAEYVFGVLGFVGLMWGLILRSYYLFGWKVYFGPKIDNLILGQIGIVAGGMIMGYVFRKFLGGIILTFSIDTVLRYLRFSIIDGKYYLGFLIDSLRFVGIKNWGIVNLDFPGYVADSLLKFRWERIWDNGVLALVIYPLVHILLGIGLTWILKRMKGRTRLIVLTVLITLVIIFTKDILIADPRIIEAIK